MDLKSLRVVRCETDPLSRGASAAAFFMGISLFLRVLYYFAFCDLSQISKGCTFTHIILPLTALVVFIVLLKGIRLKNAMVYGVVGAVTCISIMIMNFGSHNGFRVILSVLWYLLAAVVLVAEAYGIISNPYINPAAFGLALVLRLLLYPWRSVIVSRDFIGTIPELSVVCMLLGMLCYARAIRLQPETKTE